MEPQKQAKYSKLLEPDEIKEVLMGEELEETDDRECGLQSLSSEDGDITKETEVIF
jgi:hypothetical protein